MSHFSCQPCIKTYRIGSKARGEAYDKLKAAFGETRYFQYRNTDAKAKATAQADCEAFATKVRAETGLTIHVSEGFFL